MISKLVKLKFVAVFLISLVLIILQVIVLNFDSTQGYEYMRITQELDKLKFSNSILSQQVASNSSLIAITKKAEDMGFKSKKTIVSLYGPQPLAQIANTL